MKAAARQERPVTAIDLARSPKASYRVERALWRALAERDVFAASPADQTLAMLNTIRREPPEWCEAAAWEAMCDTLARWARIFGNLVLFVELGRKKEATHEPGG